MNSSLTRWLRAGRARTAILMRHAERGDIAHPAEGASVPITPKGATDAESLGSSLAEFGPIDLCHSPVGRCRQTAEALLRGARKSGAVAAMTGEEGRLGGPYLLDVPSALDKAGELGHRFVREWFDGRVSSTLLKSRRATAMEQLATIDSHLGRAAQGLLVMVTHDWNLLAVREELFGLRHEDDPWPGFMDGLVVWRVGDQLHVACGDLVTAVQAGGPVNTLI